MLDTGDAPYILHSETVAPKHVTEHQNCHITPSSEKRSSPRALRRKYTPLTESIQVFFLFYLWQDFIV